MSLMPIITLYPPWVNWVALGWKTIETRTHGKFASLAGKRIGIHASLKWDDGAIDQARAYLSNPQIAHSLEFLRVGGAIICTAFVARHRLLYGVDSQYALVDCDSVQRYGLILQDVQTIEMIPCRGKQGIWYHEVPE